MEVELWFMFLGFEALFHRKAISGLSIPGVARLSFSSRTNACGLLF